MFIGSYTENTFGKLNSGKGIVYFNNEKQIIIKENNPSFLAYKDDILYCVNEIENGEIAFYKNNLKIDCKSTFGKYPCHINIFKDKILVCNYGGGIVLYDKSIKIRNFKHENIIGQDLNRQEDSHPHSSIYLEDLNQIVVADLGNDSLYFLDENLNTIEEIKLKPGTGPRHISRKNNYLYVTNELSSSISIINITNKKVFYHPIKGYNFPSHLEIYQDKLYVANRGNNDISIYNIYENKLYLYKVIKLGGSPRHFAIDNGIIYVACQDENIIEIYENFIFKTKINIRSVTFILRI